MPRWSRASPSVSEMREKTDFLTFQMLCLNIKLCDDPNKQTDAKVVLGQRPRTCGYSRLVALYVRCTSVMGVSRYHRRKVHWYGFFFFPPQHDSEASTKSVQCTGLEELGVAGASKNKQGHPDPKRIQGNPSQKHFDCITPGKE